MSTKSVVNLGSLITFSFSDLDPQATYSHSNHHRSKDYEELTKRVSLLIRPEQKLSSLTNKESTICMLHEALEDQNWEHEIFHNRDFPYYALEAVGLEEGDKNKLSVGQFATIMSYWKALQDHGRHLIRPVALFHANGSINPEARDLIKQTLLLIVKSPAMRNAVSKPENDSEIFDKAGKKIDPIYLLSDEQLEQLFQEMAKLPKSEQQFFVVPDNQGEYIPSPNYPSDPTVRQRIYYTLGFNVFSRLDNGRRMIPSFGLMQTFLDVKFGKDAVKMNPVLALSSEKDIHDNGISGKRDYAIPFPGILLPDKADNLLAPEDDFRFHDFYHAYVASAAPKKFPPLYIQIADIVDTFINYQRVDKDTVCVFFNYKSTDSEGIKTLRDRFIDMDLGLFRSEARKYSLNDLFWQHIYRNFMSIQPPLSPEINDETIVKIATKIGRQLPLIDEILEGPKDAYFNTVEGIDKSIKELKKSLDNHPEINTYLRITSNIRALERQKERSPLKIISEIWQGRVNTI